VVQQAGAVAVSPEMRPQQHEPQDEREVKRQRLKQSNRESEHLQAQVRLADNRE
jgi:hypothetical protein